MCVASDEVAVKNHLHRNFVPSLIGVPAVVHRRPSNGQYYVRRNLGPDEHLLQMPYPRAVK